MKRPKIIVEPICCPHCGQAMVTRFGVKLPPFKALFLDMIRDVTNGRGSISIVSLASVFFNGKPKKSALLLVRQHVYQLNGWLASTDYQIIGTGPVTDRFYKLEKVEV